MLLAKLKASLKMFKIKYLKIIALKTAFNEVNASIIIITLLHILPVSFTYTTIHKP